MDPINCQGRVLWFKPHLGYGFIRPEGRKYPDVFFHWRDLKLTAEYKTIKKNTPVKFKLYTTRLGPAAKEVELNES